MIFLKHKARKEAQRIWGKMVDICYMLATEEDFALSYRPRPLFGGDIYYYYCSSLHYQ